MTSTSFVEYKIAEFDLVIEFWGFLYTLDLTPAWILGKRRRARPRLDVLKRIQLCRTDTRSNRTRIWQLGFGKARIVGFGFRWATFSLSLIPKPSSAISFLMNDVSLFSSVLGSRRVIIFHVHSSNIFAPRAYISDSLIPGSM